MAGLPDIRRLKDQPFELLREIENRARMAVSGRSGNEAMPSEWVGVGFRLRGENFLAARDQVREVLMLPDAITRVPGTQRWMLGIANIRGQLLPLIDVRLLLGGGRTPHDRECRVISVNHRDIPAGLLVDDVSGFRRFVDGEYRQKLPQTIVRCEQHLSGAFERAGEVWPVMNLKSLVESDQFLKAAG